MKEQTRKEMQQKMADCQMAIPDVSWVEIEQAVGVQKKAVTILMWRKRVAAVAAVVLLIVGGAGFWMQYRQGKGESQRAEQVGTVLGIAKTNKPSVMSEVSANPTNEPAVYVMEGNVRTADSTLVKESAQAETSTHTTEQSTYQPPLPAAITQSQTADRPHLVTASSASNARLTAKVYLGNSMNGYVGGTTFTPMLMSAQPFGKYDDEMGDEGDSPLHGDFPEFKTSIRHHQPLRFGLSLRYGIGNRWSVESGLSYCYHKSDITNLTGDSETITEQRLSYIGIPLSVGYRIWSSNRLGFYASAGGMVEKMVKGRRTVQMVTDGKQEKETTENVSIHPLQFSLNCAAGVEFRLDKSFSLYAEPGLSYHFDNGSTVPTIYQDEPLNLNLNIGLRFSFK